MAQNPYVRRLVGQQPGTQLNKPVDHTDRMLTGIGDSSFGTVGKFNRGRIDQPFFVSADKMRRFLGTPTSIRLSRLNELYLQIYQAFYGAAGAVVSRLHSDQAVNKWIVISHGDDETAISLVETLGPVTDYVLAFQMADCINEGVYLQISRSSENPDYLSIVITERDTDSEGNETDEGSVLYEFEGSPVLGALNEDGQTAFIGDIAQSRYADNYLVFEPQAEGSCFTTSS